MTGIYIEGAVNRYCQEYVSSFCETLCGLFDDVKIIHSYSGTKANRIFNVSNDRFIYYNVKDFDCWSDLKNYAKRLLKDNNIDNIIILISGIHKGFRSDNMSMLRSFCKSRLKGNDKCNFNYMMTKTLFAKYLLVEASFDVCKNVYHFMLDTTEPDYSECCNYFGYDRNKYRLLYLSQNDKCTYMPCIEYGMQNKVNLANIDINKKDIDFLFYATAVQKSREWLIECQDEIKSIPNSLVEVITSGSDKKQVPQMLYLSLLGSAKFTLAIGAYDEKSFSIYRIIDATICNCLCLVHDSCNVKDFRITFPDIYNVYKENGLFVKTQKIGIVIGNLTNDKRNDIIKKIKDTRSWKKFMDKNYIKERWKKIL